MLFLSRVGICAYLGTSIMLGRDFSISAPATSNVPLTHWELRQLDGQMVANHLRQTDARVLPPTTPESPPDSGAYHLSFAAHFVTTAQLIVHMLEADNTKLGFGLHYLNVLQQINSYKLVGNQLRLYTNPDTAPRMIFVAVAASPTQQ